MMGAAFWGSTQLLIKVFTLELAASFFMILQSSLGDSLPVPIFRMGDRELKAWTPQPDCLGMNLSSTI